MRGQNIMSASATQGGHKNRNIYHSMLWQTTTNVPMTLNEVSGRNAVKKKKTHNIV